MGNTNRPFNSRKIVFDKLSRESYFEKLNQALTNLSIVDDHKKTRVGKVKNKVNFLDKISV